MDEVTAMRCTACDVEKPSESFVQRSPGKLKRRCKDCHALAMKSAYERRKVQERKPPMPKACAKCHAVKGPDEYRKNPARPDGRDSSCKDCMSRYYASDVMRAYLSEKKASGRQGEILKKYRESHADELSKRKAEKRKRTGESVRLAEKTRRTQLRRDALDALGGKCAVCEETETSFLAIDHVGNDGAVERMTLKDSAKLFAAVVSGRVDRSRYQVLCFNHNEEKRILSGVGRKACEEDPRVRACTRCRSVKRFDQFPRDVHKSSGRKSECKECCSRRSGARKTAVMGKLGGSCACCGNENLMHLQVDHVNEDGASRRRSGEHSSIYLKVLAGTDVDGLQVLCANCNMSKAHLGSCAHKAQVIRTPSPETPP